MKDVPITESEIPSKNLRYSAHEYGSEVYNQEWFSAPNFPAALALAGGARDRSPALIRWKAQSG